MSDMLTGTATFSRKVSPKQYESAEGGLFVQFNYDPDASDEVILKEMQRAQDLVRCAVLTDMGVPFHYDGDGHIVEGVPAEQAVANVTNAFPGSTVTPTTPSSTAEPPEPTGDKKADGEAMKQWGVARFATHPDEFYDNRPKKQSGQYKPNAPDLKHKSSGRGVWL